MLALKNTYFYMLLSSIFNKSIIYYLIYKIETVIAKAPLFPFQFIAILLPRRLSRCTGCNRVLSNSTLQAADHASVHVTECGCKLNKGATTGIEPSFSCPMGIASDELTIFTICCRSCNPKITYFVYTAELQRLNL